MKNPYIDNINIIPKNDKGQIHGHVKLFYLNGNLKEEIDYVNGKIHGQRIVYGLLSEGPIGKDTYVNDKRLGYAERYIQKQLTKKIYFIT